jgi:hypothetical protein
MMESRGERIQMVLTVKAVANRRRGKHIHVFGLLPVLLSAGVCLAQEQLNSSIGATDDCNEISVDFKDDPNLTRQEKTALMDKALLDSLNKYERCQNATSRPSSSSGGGGEAGETGEGSGTGSSKQASSTASSDMSGTDAPVENASAADSQIDANEQSVNNGTAERTKDKSVAANGKIPDDIPPADNDSVLEEQIRQAAMNESDPVIKEKLWNEYRKYKGLPVTSKP